MLQDLLAELIVIKQPSFETSATGIREVAPPKIIMLRAVGLTAV
jgi:hypothetical protein